MASYVSVSTDQADKVIKSGPFIWDGATPLTLPTGQTTMLASDAQTGGYSFPPRPVTELNAADLRDKATTALATNVTYLAIASPTNAQVAAQVKVLTRECSALIRLLLNQTDDTSGT